MAAYDAGRAALALRGDKHMASAAHAASMAALGGVYLASKMFLADRLPQHWLASAVLLAAAAAALFVQAAWLVDAVREVAAAARALFRKEKKSTDDPGERRPGEAGGEGG